MQKNKLIRITTVPLSLEKLLENQLDFMSQHYEVIAISSDSERLSRFGRNMGVRTFWVEMTRKITPLKDLIALFKLVKFFVKEKPLIVHSHTPKAGTLGMIAAKIAGVPIRLHTVAGLPLMEVTGNKRRLLNFVEKITYSCATNVYPNSKGLKDFIIDSKFANPDKLKVLANGSSNGIDTAAFDPAIFKSEERLLFRKQFGISERDFVFIFVGRIVGDKGINELVNAFRSISLDNDNLKLLLVGPLESELDPLDTETLNEIDKNSAIISVGFQKDPRIHFAISDALVFPSYREGFPNVVLQAGAMGLPSIVTDINGCNEIIIKDENGIIIPVKNSEALKIAMIRMVTDKVSYNHLKLQARDMVKKHYERQVVWDALLAEYLRLEAQH